MGSKNWTVEELKFLTKHFPNMETENLAIRFTRSIAAINTKAKDLGLKKSDRFMKKRMGGRRM